MEIVIPPKTAGSIRFPFLTTEWTIGNKTLIHRDMITKSNMNKSIKFSSVIICSVKKKEKRIRRRKKKKRTVSPLGSLTT